MTAKTVQCSMQIIAPDHDPVATAASLTMHRLRSCSGEDLVARAPMWMRESAMAQHTVMLSLQHFLPRWQAARGRA